MSAGKIFTLGENNNRAIKASAGSGKTFSLAMRFISLLFLEPALDPASIVAITFTRKAAAEILDKIVDQLLEMEKDETRIGEFVANGLLPPGFSRDAIAPLVGRILNSRELQISTIDSFFVKIIQAFAPEFGLTGSVEMIDENRDSGEKETIAALIRREKEHLLPLLKEYAQGSDARNFTETLKKFLDVNYGIYLLYPEEKRWGNLPAVEDALTQEEKKNLCEMLAVGMEYYRYPSGIRSRLERIIHAAETDDFHDLKAFPECFSADGSFWFLYSRKRYPISQEMAEGIRRLFHFFAVNDFRNKVAKTRAAYRILHLFDTLYADNIRKEGRLSFRDLPKVLSEIGEEKKLDLEYRMDTRNRHYMLDEFQDTGSRQWDFMENLMSEAIQGPEQSFFMVGDVKQSLYQWRQGNPRLFDAVCDPEKYNIPVEHSDISRRSAPEVIETVNRIFLDKLDSHTAEDRKAIARMDFQRHSTLAGKKGEPLCGYAVLLSLEDNLDVRAQKIIDRLKELEYPDRALSVAVLLRTNREIEKYKQALYRLKPPSWAISTEGSVQTSESMACTFLTLLLRFAAHPGDPMAAKALPLFSWNNSVPFSAAEVAQALQLPESEEWGKLSLHLRMLLEESGIGEFVARFQRGYEGRLSKFDRERLEVAAHQADDFYGSIDEFLSVLQQVKQQSASVERTIQLMTIHKSKGLEFDVVFLPELDSLHPGGGTLLEMDPDEVSDPQWISYLPLKFTDEVLPEIRRIREKIKANQRYEKCCGLYVALTRARHELDLFVVDGEIKEKDSFRAELLLVNALAGEARENGGGILYACGDPQWHFVGKKGVKTPQMLSWETLSVKRGASLPWSSPSRDDEDEFSPLSLPPCFRFESSRAAGIGTRIHAMFESVKYWEERDPSLLDAIAGNDGISSAVKELWNFATDPAGEIVKALSPSRRPAELWREREFLIRNQAGEVISGCFDRVEIYRDASGHPERAVVYDYKSDMLETAEEFLLRHSHQLNAYREVCARMLKLPPEKVECAILALRLRKIIPVPSSRETQG